MRRHRVLGVVLLALVGCSNRSGDESDWHQWVCDSGAEVAWRYVGAEDGPVDAYLEGNRERLYHLNPEPTGSGAFYTDGKLALHLKGDSGLVYWAQSDDLIGRDCKARR